MNCEGFQIVVSTSGTAGTLLNMRYTSRKGIRNLKHLRDDSMDVSFDVVIIDEASQGSEAEVEKYWYSNNENNS